MQGFCGSTGWFPGEPHLSLETTDIMSFCGALCSRGLQRAKNILAPALFPLHRPHMANSTALWIRDMLFCQAYRLTLKISWWGWEWDSEAIHCYSQTFARMAKNIARRNTSAVFKRQLPQVPLIHKLPQVPFCALFIPSPKHKLLQSPYWIRAPRH